MTGELIPTGVTFGVGRNSINEQFSGTAEFNNIYLDSGANFSGGTGGGIIYSGGTDLYAIFGTGSSDITRVQPGVNITTGGTPNEPIINFVDSPSVNNFNASGTSNFTGVIQSGGTDLYGIFSTSTGNTTASDGLTKTGENITLGGELTGDTVLNSGSASATFLLSGDSGNILQNRILTNFGSTPAYLSVSRGKAILRSENASNTSFAEIGVSNGSQPSGIIKFEGVSGERSISFSSSVFLITNNINNSGIQYQSNYHAGYVNRSLVDKEYVDNVVATASTSNATYDYGTFSGTLNWDLQNESKSAKVVLSGNMTLDVLNFTSGDFGTLKITQDGTGSHSLTFGAGTHKVVNGGGGSITLTSTPGAIDIISFFYDGSEFNWSAGYNYT